MKIERSDTGRAWTVLVDEDELIVESGKRLPYSTWVGTINERGVINVWSPAAFKPRGYVAAAKKLLEQAREQLQAQGKLGPTAAAKVRRLVTRPDRAIRALPRGVAKHKIPVARGAVVNGVHPRGGFKFERAIVMGVVPPNDFSRAYGRQVYVCDARGTVSVSEIGAGDARPVGRVKKIPKQCLVALRNYKEGR